MPGRIPPHTHRAFVAKAVQSNWPLLCAVSVFVVVIELFNIVRVTFWSPSGLTTLNNWIYFGFYTVLLFLAAAFLLIDAFLKEKLSDVVRYRLTLAAGSVFILWNTLFGVYDIQRSISIGKISAVTSLVAFAALFIMEPRYAVVNLAASLGILLTFLSTLEDLSALLNYAIVGLLAIVIYFFRFQEVCSGLEQADELQQVNRALEESEERSRLSGEQYEMLLERGRLISFKWDMQRDEVHFSPAWEEMFGPPRKFAHIRQTIQEGGRMDARQKEALLRCMENVYSQSGVEKEELLLPVKDGSQRWFEVHIAVQKDRDGQAALGIGLLVDIMDQKNRILELEKEVSLDAFTQTLNKSALESYGARRLAQLDSRERMALLILDMDDFKNINDTYGHQAGDHVLLQLGRRMKDLAPAHCRVGRLGGDEFAAIFEPPCTRAAVEAYAARLIDAVRGIEWEGQPMPTACSIGISACAGGASYDSLYAAADKALYEAKRQGKGRYCLDPDAGLP